MNFRFKPFLTTTLLVALSAGCAHSAPTVQTRAAFQLLPKPTVTADNIVFPADAGVADVTKAPYNADPTGKTDATMAIQKALTEKKNIVYLPNGTYLISDQLRWGDRQTRQILQGQSESGTILKLADKAPGYGSPTSPKSMIWTGRAPAQRFRNGIRNLTVNTGQNNAGAIGVQYMSNNQGGMHHVTIESGDGSGPIGLDLGYSNEQGPCLIKNITVKGFDVGIFTKHAVDGVVLENIRLENQNEVGFLNDGQCVSMRNFSSRNAVPAFINKRGASLLALDVADLQGTGAASREAAIVNQSGLFARNITTANYKLAIDNQSGKLAEVADPRVGEFVSHPILSLFPSPPRSLNLPVKETPHVPWDDPQDWVNVRDYKPKVVSFQRPNDGKKFDVTDWTDAIQQAIDAGKSTVYFPGGSRYLIMGTVHVRGKVRRLIGMDVDVWGKPGGVPGGTISFDDGEAPVVLFERFDVTYSGLKFEHNTKRSLVFSSNLGNEWVKFIKKPGSGDVFMEDVGLGQYIAADGNTWARQFNLEGWNLRPKIINDGGNLWILGYKTEEDALLLDAKNNAKSEILGGFIYANKKRDPEKVMFASENSALSVTVGEWVGRQQPFNPVRETRDGQTRILKAKVAPGRGEGAMIPLFVGYSGPSVTLPVAPENLAASAATTSQINLKWSIKPGADGVSIEKSLDGQTFETVDSIVPDAGNYSIRGGLKAGTPYFVRLTAYNGKGQAASEIVKVATQAPAPVGAGTGLRGEYYDDRKFSNLKATRTDAGVNFSWKTAAPVAGVAANNMAARWTGQIEPRYGENYQFFTDRQGTRLWLDGELIIDGWNSRNWTGSKLLEAGRKYDLKMEMQGYDANGGATLAWRSFNQPREPIAATQLYPAKSALPELKLTVSDRDVKENIGKPIQIIVARQGDSQAALRLALDVGGSAGPNVDYKELPHIIVVPAGSDKVTLPLEIINDTRAESDQEITLALQPGANYNLSGGTERIVIGDDDLPPASNGTGLRGEYFGLPNYTDRKGTRLDERVSFGWDKSAPFQGIVVNKKERKTNGYAVVWTGQIEPLFSEKYTFELNFGSYADAKLTVGDTVVVNAKGKTSPRAGQIELKAGQKYPIKIEMSQQNFYDGRMQLKWSSPSQFEQIVPKSQLFPSP